MRELFEDSLAAVIWAIVYIIYVISVGCILITTGIITVIWYSLVALVYGLAIVGIPVVVVGKGIQYLFDKYRKVR
jgi:hypothetical protein